MSMINNIKGGIINAHDHLWVRNKSREEFKSKNNQDFKSIASSYALTDEQKKQIDLLYKENFGERIPYCWHQFFAAHSGVFTSEYFPDYLLHAYFERYCLCCPDDPRCRSFRRQDTGSAFVDTEDEFRSGILASGLCFWKNVI